MLKLSYEEYVERFIKTQTPCVILGLEDQEIAVYPYGDNSGMSVLLDGSEYSWEWEMLSKTETIVIDWPDYENTECICETCKRLS